VGGQDAAGWEPEPLRFAGIRSVYGLYRAADRLEARSHRRRAEASARDG